MIILGFWLLISLLQYWIVINSSGNYLTNNNDPEHKLWMKNLNHKPIDFREHKMLMYDACYLSLIPIFGVFICFTYIVQMEKQIQRDVNIWKSLTIKYIPEAWDLK